VGIARSLRDFQARWKSGNRAFFARFSSPLEKSGLGLFHGAAFPQPFRRPRSVFSPAWFSAVTFGLSPPIRHVSDALQFLFDQLP